MNDLVLAVTGASGSAYAIRLLDTLLSAQRQVHLVFSAAGLQVLKHELGLSVNAGRFEVGQLLPERTSPADSDLVTMHDVRDYSAGIASGSFRTSGMVICPCSMGTLSSVAHGLSTNLIQRAADVHLKERRRLILVPRETPLGSIQLENMKRLADAGAVLLPAMPGFYHNPQKVSDLVDFVVARICDQLDVPHDLMRRWGDTPLDSSGDT
ncbi:MAG: UbiX family flavin prenyltransferase [Planctomycetota bacterium]|jgi:4-hydroxy-3-polyprenylbenzoate decarboxylase